MPFVDPSTVQDPTTGQAITAAWGDQINANQNYMATTRPHCSVYNSGTQSVGTAPTLTALTADSELSDIGGMHSTVSNTSRITIPTGEGGLYECSCTVSFASNATGYRHVQFYKNGTTEFVADQVPAVNGAVTIISAKRPISLAAGEYVEVRVRQSSGGNLDVTLLDFTVDWSATA